MPFSPRHVMFCSHPAYPGRRAAVSCLLVPCLSSIFFPSLLTIYFSYIMLYLVINLCHNIFICMHFFINVQFIVNRNFCRCCYMAQSMLISASRSVYGVCILLTKVVEKTIKASKCINDCDCD